MIALLLAAALGGAEPAPPLRLATYAYPAFDRAAAVRPLGEVLARAYGRPVTVAVLPTPDALAQAVREGRADFAVTNLASYLAMADAPGVRAIAVLDTPPTRLDSYRGVLVARRAAGVADMAGLKAGAARLRYVEALPGSTSGALVQAGRMRRDGYAPRDFAGLAHAGSHDAALQRLVDGAADVAAATEAAWKTLLAREPDVAKDLVVLWRSDPLPPGPVVCRAGLSLDCAPGAAALMSAAGLPAVPALAAAWPETEGAPGFRAVTPGDYAAFRAK
ncbi:MAG: hypothetical protein DI570_02885 [Phenylobacterium zucineum]|nr:MAG: hypothetical protein DI570_02885 [Phenylobacterium zucineum]